MSKNWAIVLVAITFTSVGALIGSVIAPQTVEANPAPRGPERVVAPPRINYFNLAKVLREFQKANSKGKVLTAKRHEFENEVKEPKEELAAAKKQLEAANGKEKAALQKKIKELSDKVDEIEKRGQKELSEFTDQLIVEVYTDIRRVIGEIAKEKGLDVVEACPDVSDEKDHNRPAVAQLKLQTPALMPFYMRPEFDITDAVIERINAKCPPEKEDN